MLAKLKAYYALTKPGIIKGNLLTTIGAFLYGEILRIDITTMIGIVLGTATIIAAGCVINNYLDRDIDQYMQRTKKRALVLGTISNRSALTFATILAASGIATLLLLTNVLTAFIGVIGLVSYAFVYTYAKRVTVHSTLIGTIPGAIPPVAGYTAATNTLDVSALLLFLILVAWQMVHFYSISIYRMKEYKKARVPLMVIVHGVENTKLQMIAYGCAFLIALFSLAYFGYAGLLYLVITGVLGVWWLLIVFGGLYTRDNEAWARKVFGVSLIVLLSFSFSLAINAWVP